MQQVQILSYDNVDKLANKFLAQFSFENCCPINIEALIDFKLRYKILPFPKLESAHGIVGFTCIIEKAIYIDKDIYEDSNENRFRYTLAHEAGHIHLHNNFFTCASLKSLDNLTSYKLFLKTVAYAV